MNLTELDKRLIRLLQGDVAVVARPFAQMARTLGVEEAWVLERLREYKETGVIRRFGATLHHQRSGYPANVMVAWLVPEDQVDAVGAGFSAVRQVSHCYSRRTAPDWPYNLYTMVHGQTREACLETVREMAAQAGLSDHQLLFSKRELKKTTMRYFDE